ncbi:hypothetical protein [Bradyrhizobium sp. BR 1432]|uniref:hypothetical protein n=1 Tax=Bradyrhizobium sp. BR 1432 TaxID=3447966 RepID=UPI003EE6B6A7
MKKYLIAAAVPLLLATTADAAPKMPSMFHGRWCGENHMLKHCGKNDDGIRITADGFEYEAGEFGCRLIGLTPQKPTRRDVEYRATFVCGGEKIKSHRLYYRIGFYDDDRNDGLFMWETDSTFMKETKHDF